MGGGGFSTEGERSPLDEELLRLARARRGVDRPRVCFIPTASGDSPDYLGRFHQAFDDVAEASHLTLFDRRGRGHPAVPAGPGRDLRRRRQHAEPARGLAGPRRRRRAAGLPRGRGRARRAVGRLDLLVRGRHDRLVRPDPPAARRRARAHRRQPLPALRRGAPAPPDLPRARRRRPPRARAGHRRRRGRAARRTDARRGRRLGPRQDRLPRRARRPGRRRSRPRWRPGSWRDPAGHGRRLPSRARRERRSADPARGRRPTSPGGAPSRSRSRPPARAEVRIVSGPGDDPTPFGAATGRAGPDAR